MEKFLFALNKAEMASTFNLLNSVVVSELIDRMESITLIRLKRDAAPLLDFGSSQLCVVHSILFFGIIMKIELIVICWS